MADVLSQGQIDELLKSMAGGGAAPPTKEPEEKLKIYDFKAPKKFVKDDLKIIHDVFDVYARLISSYLTGETRLFCQMKVISIEEQRYFEFSNALEDFVMMGTIGIQPKDEELSDATYLLQFSNSISLTIIDRMMGGQGTYVDIDRDFTEIEIGLIRRVMSKMSGILKESWADYLDVEADLVGIETNSRLNKSISSDETIVLVTFELEINDISNMVAMIVPAVSMGEMMNKFSNKSKRINKHFDPNREMEIRRSLLNRVSRSNLNINAVLSQTQIELGDLLMLQPEDLIYLDMGINENVTVNISGLPWYEGKMGTVNNRKAIKIIGLDQKQMR